MYCITNVQLAEKDDGTSLRCKGILIIMMVECDTLKRIWC